VQESRMASAAGNATAGRELSGLSPHRSSLFSDQTALGTNIRTYADLSSALVSTSIGANAEPVQSLLYICILFSSLLSMGSGGWAASLHRPNPSSGIFDL